MARLDKSRIWLLVMSLILSIALRAYISGEESIELKKDVYLKIIPPDGMALIGEPVRKVEVTLVAPRNILALLGQQKINVEYELSGDKKPGRYTFFLREHDIPLPQRGINVTDISPKQVDVELDVIVGKELKVKPVLIGSVPDGYVVDKENIFMDPSSVLVRGPKKMLDEIDTVKTREIDVIGRTRSFRIRVELNVPPNIEVENHRAVDVFIPIRNEGVHKVIKGVPIYVMSNPLKDFLTVITPPIVDLDVKGPKSLIDKLDKKDIRAYVDITALPKGEYQLPILLDGDKKVSVYGNVPVVNVKIEDRIKGISTVGMVKEEEVK